MICPSIFKGIPIYRVPYREAHHLGSILQANASAEASKKSTHIFDKADSMSLVSQGFSGYLWTCYTEFMRNLERIVHKWHDCPVSYWSAKSNRKALTTSLQLIEQTNKRCMSSYSTYHQGLTLCSPRHQLYLGMGVKLSWAIPLMIVSLAYTLPEIEISIWRKTLFCFDEKGPHGHDSLYPEPILFENHFLQPHKPSIQARIT